ncbi:hypothetical protein D3C81_1985920 [compost metagenome]
MVEDYTNSVAANKTEPRARYRHLPAPNESSRKWWRRQRPGGQPRGDEPQKESGAGTGENVMVKHMLREENRKGVRLSDFHARTNQKNNTA